MNNLDDVIYINQLLDIYGELLSHGQKEILSLYFRYNLSISEIANEKDISRSAVNDALKKGVKTLQSYENKMMCFAKKEAVDKLIKELSFDEKNKKIIDKFNQEYNKNGI